MQTFVEVKTSFMSGDAVWTASKARERTDRSRFIRRNTQEEQDISCLISTLRKIENASGEGLSTLQITYPISNQVKETLKEMGYTIEDMEDSDYVYISW